MMSDLVIAIKDIRYFRVALCVVANGICCLPDKYFVFTSWLDGNACQAVGARIEL